MHWVRAVLIGVMVDGLVDWIGFAHAQLISSTFNPAHITTWNFSMATELSDCRDMNGDEISTINGEAEASLTHQTRTTPRSILEQWYDVTNRREMILVAVGRSGAGKSTLISSMLRLKDVDALQDHHTSSPVTQEVEIYAPVNCMPHYPLYGERWGNRGGFT